MQQRTVRPPAKVVTKAKNVKLARLYAELSVIVDAQKAFVAPRSADHPGEWSQQEAERFALLVKQRNEIIAEITQLEMLPD